MKKDTLNVLIFGSPYFFADAACCDIKTFNIRIDQSLADISLPLGLYDAWYLLACAKEKGFEPDIFFIGDESYPPLLFNLEELDIPVVFYAVDTHINPWHVEYSMSVDLLLLAQKKYLEIYSNHETDENKFFLPLYAPSSPPPCLADSSREPHAVFVGNLDPKLHPVRHDFFSKLQDKCNIQLHRGPYLDFFSKARIVVNHSSHEEINFRVFEALYSGAMLITDHVPYLEDLFQSGGHLVSFNSRDITHAAELVNYYLRHDDERVKVAMEGQREVLGHHVRKNRMLDIAGKLRSLPLDEFKKNRLNSLDHVKKEVSKAYSFWSNISLLPKDCRDSYASLAQGEIIGKSVLIDLKGSVGT